MKDIMQKLAELEATAPKITKKKMLNEDSTTPPINVSNKPASLKDMFESIAGMKPIPVVGKEGGTQQTGAGFLNVTDNSPAAQALGKALGDLAGQKKVQIVVPAQGQPGQPNQAGATGQPQQGQLAVQEKDEGKPGKNFAKIAKSAGERYGSKAAGERVAGAIRAKLAKQGKLEEEQIEELSTDTLKRAASVALSKSVKAANKHGGEMRKKDSDWAQRDMSYNDYVGPEAIKRRAQSHKFSQAADDKLGEGAKVDRMVKHIEKSERGLGKSKEKASDIAWATVNKRGYLDNKNKKKVKEADIPSTQGIDTQGAGLGAGRSPTTLEGKTMSKKAKPDFLDMDKDGNKKESMKKAVADKKKKTVKEGMSHRIAAARFEGKSDGLRGGKNRFKDYEDLEEARAYHEGYKDGLDECYGQGVYETAPAATVPGMASQAMPAMEDEMEEGNAFTAALAKTPKGGQFKVGGKTFTDRTGYDAKLGETDYAFEAWDRELSNLLNEGTEVNEGLSVSVSKGQQNTPDSVTITAQDAEADQLLQLVKHAGLGLFGDDHAEPSSAMSIQPAHGEPDEVGAGGVDIDVVDGSDDMLSLMQKLSGVEATGGDEDYADEEGHDEFHDQFDSEEDSKEDTDETTCNECGGMMEAGHTCSSKMVDEVESEDQQEFEVAEDNAPDSDEAETSADEEAEADEDKALALKNMNESFFDLLGRLDKLSEGSGDEPKHPEHDKKDDKDYDDEEDVTESAEEDEEAIEESEDLTEWANQVGNGPGKGTDASFEEDIDFMTKVIAGGLNKPKSTGQTTVPVIPGQTSRMHDHQGSVSETVDDWVKLAGIK